MRLLLISYYVVSFSPLLSGILYKYFPKFLKLMIGQGYSRLPFGMVDTGVHTLVIVIQVRGIILYLVEYKKEKGESGQVPFTVLFSLLLILWGLLVSWFAIGFYNNEVIPWSMEPDVRELTIWDHLEYATWTLKGLLWIASGMIFLVTSYFKRELKSKVEELG